MKKYDRLKKGAILVGIIGLTVYSSTPHLLASPATGERILSTTERAISDPSVFAVAGQPYSLKQLTGHTKEELKFEFDSEVKKMSDESLKKWINKYSYSQDGRDGKTVSKRSDLEETLWKAVYYRLLDDTIRPIVLSAITQHIVKNHGIDLKEYFDMSALHDGFDRELAYLNFRYEHQHDPANKDPELLAEAIKKFRFGLNQEYWKATATEFRERPAFMKWSVDAMKYSEDWGGFLTNAMLLHALLSDACEKGVYHDRAEKYFQFQWSQFRVVDITGYEGGEDVLREYLSQVISQDGEVAGTGISDILLWFRDLSPSVRIKQTTVIGTNLLDGFAVPQIGVLYRPQPDTLRIIGWQKKLPLKAETPEEQKAMGVMQRNYAYQLAIASLLPTVESRVPGWSPEINQITAAITVDGPMHDLPEVQIDPYIKKPYPSLIFAEFEQTKSDLQELIVKSAKATLLHDKESAKLLITEIKDKAEKLKTTPVRNAYLAVSKKLSSAFNF